MEKIKNRKWSQQHQYITIVLNHYESEVSSMKSKILRRVLSSVLAGMTCFIGIPSGTPAPSNAATEVYTKSIQSKSQDGFDFELWNENDTGNVIMTLNGEGSFSCDWRNIQNCLFRTGKRLGSTQKWQEYNGITLDYNVDYHPEGNSYMCVYGWTQQPLVEYYIVEGWGDWKPPEGNNAAPIKQVTINGELYDIYKSMRWNKPSIEGDKDFPQYWSVRHTNPAGPYQETHMEGTVDVAAHFKAWEDCGFEMGNLYEVALNIEGYMSKGSAVVNKNKLTFGEGGTEPEDVKPLEADENGVYFTSTFEKGTDSWNGRGNAAVSKYDKSYYEGSNSLLVSGRKNNWNGASYNLDGKAFVAGKSYSFSGAVLQNSGSPVDIKMTLQYIDKNGEEKYDEIRTVTAKSGEWTEISNTGYTIPEGASNLLLYFEAPDDLTDFYIDSFTAAVGGKPSSIVTGKGVVEGSGIVTPPAPEGQIRGDFNGDKVVDSFDLITARDAIIKRMAGTKISLPLSVSDLNADNDFTIADIVTLQKYVLGSVRKLKEPVTTTTATTSSTTTTTVTTNKNNDDYMQSILPEMQISAPSGFNQKRGGVDYGKLETVTYYSKDGNMNKNMCVILPAGYNTSEKYPVLYCLHGIGGNETSMPGMGVQTMLGNLLADGLCEKMIIVCPNMYTAPGNFSYTAESMRNYDRIREDIENSIMPYMEEHYSVKTGRDNTAITGFSLGGREALYTGVTRSQLYGYIGGACPAPGIFKTKDFIMEHEGCLQESEFKPSTEPYMLLISAAANDGVVGTYPQSYSQALDNNKVEHIWQVIPNGDHGNATVDPHMYNFLRFVFKAN